MDHLLCCRWCFKCSLTSAKGTYNTYDRERNQAACSSNNERRGLSESSKSGQTASDIDGSNKIKRVQYLQYCLGAEDYSDAATSSHSSSCSSNQLNQEQMSFRQSGKNRIKDEPSGPVLSQFNLDGIAELINEKRISLSSVIVLVGAGMSTAAGVPDFRSPGTGIYANLQKYNLPHPEDVFKIDYFKNNPAPFYDLSRQILPDKLYPTLSHYFVRLLHEKGYLLRCYSQNVDCLESLCGLPKERLCLAHGSFETGHCLRCNADYSLAWMRKIVEEGGIPHCTKTQDCKGLIKPDVKFFGERLDGRFFRLAKEDFPKCELLIIIGSSLTVMPFAQLVQRVPPRCPRLLINKTKSGHDLPLVFRLFKPSDGLMYDKKGNIRDVAFIGDCDEASLQLSSKLGWNGDLIEMARKRRQELDQDQSRLPIEN